MISIVIFFNLFCSVSSCPGLSYRQSSRNQQQISVPSSLGGETKGCESTRQLRLPSGSGVSLWRNEDLIAFQGVCSEVRMIKDELSVFYCVSSEMALFRPTVFWDLRDSGELFSLTEMTFLSPFSHPFVEPASPQLELLFGVSKDPL